MPTAQVEQLEAPGSLYAPAGHSEHTEEPVAELKEPAAQSTHAKEEVACVALLYEPAAQPVQLAVPVVSAL